MRVTNWTARAVRDAIEPSPTRMRIFPSYTASSFDDLVGLALLKPEERPHQHTTRGTSSPAIIVRNWANVKLTLFTNVLG